MLALAVLGSAEARRVKIQVDMTGKTISANGLHVAGNFQASAGVAGGDWQPGATTLTNGGSGNIYSVIVNIPAGKMYEYKFINDNNWGAGEEAIPAISQVGSVANGGSNGNRWMYIDSLNTTDTVMVTLPAVMFAGDAPTGKSALRFAVDLQNEASVSALGVHIAGNFQGANGASGDWKPNESRLINLFTNNKVFEFIAYVDVAAGVEWKYLNGNDWPQSEGVPSTCQVNGNRGYTATATSVALAKVCFGSCIACPTAPIPSYKLMFQVDMTNTDCDGGYDSITVAGAGARLTAFGSGLKMAPVGITKIFALTVDSLDSGEVEFKFRFHKNGNTNWEGGSNRLFAHKAIDTVGLTCFGSRALGACPSKPAPSSITFKVDITDTIPGVLFVMGTFQTPNWQPGALRMAPVTGQPGIFSVTVNNVCPGIFNYKFVNAYNADSSDTKWEEKFVGVTDSSCIEPSGVGGFNRKYTRTSAAPVTLSFKFNSCTPGSNVGISEVALSAGFKLFPNPAESYTMVEFNDKAMSHEIVVMDIAGKVIQSFNNYRQNTLLINTDDMSKGVYFIKASNTRNESVTSKLIVR